MMDGGFLADPAAEQYASALKHLVSTDALPTPPVLVLLGEAGLGKSVEVRRLAGKTAQLVDLGEFGDENVFERELSDQLRVAAAVEGGAVLVLDALDEILIGIPKAAATILRCLRKVPQPLPRIIITCRTGAWPATFGGQLAPTVGADKAPEFELAMLRRDDVRLAATASGVDPDKFMYALAEVDAEPLAASPATLHLLLRLFGSGKLPRSRVELYEAALLKLCEQPAERRDRGGEPTDGHRALAPAEMLAAATRIAAMTVLSGRSQVTLHGLGEGTAGAMHVSEFAGGTERAGDTQGVEVEVSEHLIRETLKHTGLFSARTSGTLGFAHRSYGEFLAARFLAHAKLHPVQLASVMYTEGVSGRRIAPQLAETAAWLSDLDQVFREDVMQVEPGALLRSDLRAWSPAQRRELIASLLDGIRGGRLADLDSTIRSGEDGPSRVPTRKFLRQLTHDSLSEQIGPIIRSGVESEAVRAAAIEIAIACKSAPLAADCAGVALDRAAPESLRTGAAYAVRAIGEPVSCSKLLPLVSDPGDDLLDSIKGCALCATWPKHLPVIDLLQALTPPKRKNLHGAYSSFLDSVEVDGRISDAELPRALAWAKAHPDMGDFQTPIGAIASRVAYEGWLRLELADVRAAMSDLILTRITQRSLLFRAPSPSDGKARYRRDEEESAAGIIQQDDARRRSLLSACLCSVVRREDVRTLVYASPSLISPSDFGWALDRACELLGDGAERFAWLADTLGMRCVADGMDRWLEAREKSPWVRRLLDYPTQTVVESPEAKKAWWRWARDKVQARTRDRRWKRELPTDSRMERLHALLDRCEREDVRWWPHVSEILLYDDDWHATFHFNLMESPGWTLSDEPTHVRITGAAERYLAECQIEAGGENDPGIDNLAAIQAAILLKAGGGGVVSLSGERLAKVAPALLGGISSWKEGEVEHCVGIAHECFQRASVESGAAVCALVAGVKNEFLPDVMNLEGLVVPEATRLELLRLAALDLRGHKVFRLLLTWLVESHTPGAAEFAMSLLGGGAPTSDEGRAHAKAAAQSLMKVPEVGWEAIWGSVTSDPAWGDELLRAIVPYDTRDLPPLGEKIGMRRLGEVVERLMERFAPEDDPEHDGVYSPTQDEYVRRWRSGLLRVLISAGAVDAVVALRRMRDRWTKRAWLSRVVMEAEINCARTTWTPIPPRHLLELRVNTQRRSVRTGVELIEVLAESLRRFERTLRESDTVATLWNEVKKGVWRPKDEETLSDLLVAHLRTDLEERGVILGRELQISRRRSAEGEAGMRLDIAATAITHESPGSIEHIKAVIEVKGSWNAEAETGLEAQLIGRYLREHGASHGLFVVGWYGAAGWDRNDHRRRSGPWHDIVAARAALSEQAARAAAAHPALAVVPLVLDVALR